MISGAIDVWIVSGYCRTMVGNLEPLEFRPEESVIRPLMVLTAVVSMLLYPLLLRQRTRLNRGLLLYLGFVLISVLYGFYIWSQFPDGSAWAVLVAVIGGHLYGAPVFLVVLLANLLLGRVLFPAPKEERGWVKIVEARGVLEIQSELQVAGLNSRIGFDKILGTLTSSSGSPSYSLVVHMADGRSFASGSSESRAEVETLEARVSSLLGSSSHT